MPIYLGNKVRKHLFAFSFFILLFSLSNAQSTRVLQKQNKDYSQAMTLYATESYLGAQQLFEQIAVTTTDPIEVSNSMFYAANCAVKLNQPGAEKQVLQFVENYPNSTKRHDAYLGVAGHYYSQSKYTHALKWYEKVDEDQLSAAQKEALYFSKGYSLFVTKQKKTAKKYFQLVEDSSIYGSQATYYLGYLAYEGEDYEKASSLFEQVKDQEKYQEKMAYFQADMNFKLGRFKKAIELADQRLSVTLDEEERSQLNKIVGESYFNLKAYDKAYPYLKAYQGKKGKWLNTDHYQLGYIYYTKREYAEAIKVFNKIIDGKNSVAQNAYYHLAQCYVHTNKKTEALNAFKNASELSFSKTIQQDATLNYAKLSYEIGNPYQSVSEVLLSYLSSYPEDSNKEELEALLIDSYISANNYQEAFHLLEGKKGALYKEMYQKVAFYRGVDLYIDAQYVEAKTFFGKAIQESRTPIITVRATYWQAETDYYLSDYDAAISGYLKAKEQIDLLLEEEKNTLQYNLAYAYFKQKKYDLAIAAFDAFLNPSNMNQEQANDAYLRLADCYFVTAQYRKAMEVYNTAKQRGGMDADYAHYQKAISYGFVGKYEEKIKDLNQFLLDFPKSTYRDNALFELGNTYVIKNKTQEAIQAYNDVVYKHTSSPFVPSAMLKQGLVYYNQDSNEQALNKFKQVATNYPGTAEANQAVATARLIYVDLDRVAEYASWVKTLDFVEVTDADIDNTAYEAAEKLFLQQKIKQAIASLSSYLDSFPKGLHATKAHFYLAQLHLNNLDKERALEHYKALIALPQNEFTEQSLIKASQILIEQELWSEVQSVLEALEDFAGTTQNKTYAQSNLMKAYEKLEQHQKAKDYAVLILGMPNLSDAIRQDAFLVAARASVASGDEVNAQKYYSEVLESGKGIAAAEAMYYKAYFEYQAEAHQASNATIQEFTKLYSGYKFFAAKALVLMAKNFYALEDAYQATYILERVIENFTQFEEVKVEAETELEQIKQKEAQRNASIDIEPKTENKEKE